MKRRNGYNPKRRMCSVGRFSTEQLSSFAARAHYAGNPEHKIRPGDYGLTPPTSPRPGKTLCDAKGEFPKAIAEELLRNGFHRGLISVKMRNDWPQNVWSVKDGVAFEAQLENSDTGAYHGYPMPIDDDFCKIVLENWKIREPKIDH